MLGASNVFMTAAWHGHLDFASREVITLLVFVAFAWLYLGERLRWNEATAFALVLGAVIVANLPG